MNARARLALAGPLLTAALFACGAPTEVHLRGNGAFSSDGGAALLVESVYRTTRPEQPWFNATSATRWEVVFSRAGSGLEGATELARFPDSSQAQGGGCQAAPVFWVEASGRAVLLEYGEARVYDLVAKRVVSLTVPPPEASRVFATAAGDMSAGAAPLWTTPSPDGAHVAVFFTSAWEGPNGPTDLRFVHAVAFFDAAGSFERAAALSAWTGTDQQLQLTPPPLVPPLQNPEPPAPSQRQLAPGENAPRFVWTHDSAAVVVVDVTRDDQGAIVAGHAQRVEVATGAVVDVDRVPALAVPSPFGPVRPDGAHLVVERTAATPNTVSLSLHATTNWVPFEKVGEVPVLQATYAW